MEELKTGLPLTLNFLTNTLQGRGEFPPLISQIPNIYKKFILSQISGFFYPTLYRYILVEIITNAQAILR